MKERERIIIEKMKKGQAIHNMIYINIIYII